nr:PREDICTED: cadherin-4-like [Lepisosteus oculatus]
MQRTQYASPWILLLKVAVTNSTVPNGILQCITIEVFVIDMNDNVSEFSEESMTGIVQTGLIAGVPFMQVKATDLDDPTTANAELHYSLIDQSRSAPSSSMFSIDAQTGSVSLTAEGASSLDPEVCHQYNMTANVKILMGSPLLIFQLIL